MSKALIEKQNELKDEMTNILNLAMNETRALTDEENEQFNALEKEANGISDLLQKEAKMEIKELVPVEDKAENTEVKDFADCLKGIKNIERGDGTVVIPKTISQQIIAKVYELSPIYQRATKYNTKGTLVIPYVDMTNSTLAMAWVSEGSDVSATQDKLLSVELSGHLAGLLTKISKSLLNNTDIDLVNFVVNEIATRVATFIDYQCLRGSVNSQSQTIVGGLTEVSTALTLASNSAITADELIELQDKVIGTYQANACWIMSRATKTAIRKLKDDENRYIFQHDMTGKFEGFLLGAPVFTSENMEGFGSGKTVIYYGDMSGLAIEMVEQFNVEILRERYAPQHMLGVTAFVEFDAKVANQQKLAKAVCPQ